MPGQTSNTLGIDDARRRRPHERAAADDAAQGCGALNGLLDRRPFLDALSRALVGAVEAKDPCTRHHSERVSEYARTLGARLGLPPSLLESLRTAAILHDVGKIGIPDAILRKPGPLTAEEYDVVKRHPDTGLRILGHASFLGAELPIIRHHHERYDGGGYPSRLVGTQIPFGARILAVADALDAMFSTRTYRKNADLAGAHRELQRCAGTQWDPDVVQTALEWLDASPDTFTTR